MIELNDLGFSYQDTNILSNIDLTISKGECVVLCGESGCGKSTLIRALNGLSPELYPGEVTGSNKVLNTKLPAKNFHEFVKEIGVVFQNPKTQFFTNDVYSELAFSMENYGIHQDEMIHRIDKMAAVFSLQSYLEKSMFHLSGGEKQRIAFASACMMSHSIFLLDEPSSNLDFPTIEVLKSYLVWLKEQGATILIAEHRLFYLSDVADRYVLMEKGHIKGNYSKKEMRSLKSSELSELGLRSLKPTKLVESCKKSKLEKRQEGFQITCSNLRYQHKKAAQGIFIPQLTLDSNDVVGLVGANGAGKTTVSSILAGLTKPKQGAIFINDKKMTSKQLINKSFLVMQDVNLQLFFETVQKELLVNAQRKELFDEVVDKLKLRSLLLRHPQTLSGGEKQRVAIGSAVLSGKELIILDEPTSGLDLKHMEEVSDTIKWLNQSKVLVIIISHDFEFIDRTCQRIIKLNKGEIIKDFYLKNRQSESK